MSPTAVTLVRLAGAFDLTLAGLLVRAEADVGLIISEGTGVDRPASLNDKNVPRFHGEKELAAWKTVIDEVHAAAPWMKKVINLAAALEVVPGKLHPGAEKYYREIGRKLPVAFQPGDKWVAR